MRWQDIENHLRSCKVQSPPPEAFWPEFRRRAETTPRDLAPGDESVPPASGFPRWAVAGIAAACVLVLVAVAATLTPPGADAPPVTANLQPKLQVVDGMTVSPGESGVKNLELAGGRGALVMRDAGGRGTVLWVPHLVLEEENTE